MVVDGDSHAALIGMVNAVNPAWWLGALVGEKECVKFVDLHYGDFEPNALIVGEVGSGLHYFVSSMICLNVLQGRMVRIIDRDGSYSRLLNYLGGEYVGSFVAESSNGDCTALLSGVDSQFMSGSDIISQMEAADHEFQNEDFRKTEKVLILSCIDARIFSHADQEAIECLYRSIRAHNGSIVFVFDSAAALLESPVFPAIYANSFKTFVCTDGRSQVVSDVFGATNNNMLISGAADAVGASDRIRRYRDSSPVVIYHAHGNGFFCGQLARHKRFHPLFTTDSIFIRKFDSEFARLRRSGISFADALTRASEFAENPFS